MNDRAKTPTVTDGATDAENELISIANANGWEQAEYEAGQDYLRLLMSGEDSPDAEGLDAPKAEEVRAIARRFFLTT